MENSRLFASLSPSLLARKGGARPAMRPQYRPLEELVAAQGDEASEDLGWNDMGEEADPQDAGAQTESAQILSLHGEDSPVAEKPEVILRREQLGARLANRGKGGTATGLSARRAAFTLRIDPERHLRLRLASTVTNRSAQQLVTEALDRLLDTMPEIESLADNLRKRS